MYHLATLSEYALLQFDPFSLDTRNSCLRELPSEHLLQFDPFPLYSCSKELLSSEKRHCHCGVHTRSRQSLYFSHLKSQKARWNHSFTFISRDSLYHHSYKHSCMLQSDENLLPTTQHLEQGLQLQVLHLFQMTAHACYVHQ